MTTVLITGANRGIGYETARRLIDAGNTVWMGARDERRGSEAADTLGGRFVRLDVTDDVSVAAAVQRIAAAGGLDVLVNNAGVGEPSTSVDELTGADALSVFDINVFGMIRLITACTPLLRQSSAPTIVNVSSGMGSFAVMRDASRPESAEVAPLYTSSKAAVNMLTVQYALALPEMRVNAADPGYTATDINAHRGTQTVAEGAEVIVELATRNGHGPSGTFSNRAGAQPF